jgi:protein ImuB
VEKVRGAQRIVAVDAAAARLGVRVGANLADARAAHPGLRVAEGDPAADRRLLEAIAEWCDRYTPLVALDPPDGLFLDISGCSHLFDGERGEGDGEARLLADCLRRLAGRNFSVAGAVASTAGAASALARYGSGGIVAAGMEAEAVAGLPVAALRIDAEAAALLDRLGLKRIGQLLGKPRAPLAARFGVDLVRRLDQALGIVDEALSPRRPAPPLIAERRFVEPVAEEEALFETLGSLARTLQAALTPQGIGARLLQAAFFRTDGAVVRLDVGTAEPLRDAKTVGLLFRERLAALGADWDAGFGFDMVRLAVLSAERLDETQIDLSGETSGGPDFVRLVDRLGARLGRARITRFEAVDTHIPERAVRATPLAAMPKAEAFDNRAGAARSNPLAGSAAAAHGDLSAEGRGGDRSEAERGEAPPGRPLKLFDRPERVEVIAEIPEGPPLKFRWRRVVHDVARAEGPERIAPEWWRPEDAGSATRDYFRVEDSEGRRYWIFRAGLYGRETAGPLWYVHGLFA